MLAYVVSEGRLFALNPSDWAMLLIGVALCGLPILGPANERAAVTLKFISAVIAAAAFAGVLTLLWATSMRLDAGPARDAAPQSTPVTQTALAATAPATSPELVQQLDAMARDLAVLRRSIEEFAAKQEHLATAQEQLAAKQDQMTQNIATLQAAEQDIIQTKSSPPQSGPVSPPPRKKARRVAPPKLAAQSSSVPFPAFRPQ